VAEVKNAKSAKGFLIAFVILLAFLALFFFRWHLSGGSRLDSFSQIVPESVEIDWVKIGAAEGGPLLLQPRSAGR